MNIRIDKEYGYVFGIEMPRHNEYFLNCDGTFVKRLNSARSCITLAAITEKAKTVYLPKYICDSVTKTLILYGIIVKHYDLDDELKPKLNSINQDSIIVVVNYFGNFSDNTLKSIAKKYKKVIFDNSQGFFANPIFSRGIYNVYSPRKFFGVSDGGYLVWKGKEIDTSIYRKDLSWSRAKYLLKRLDENSNNSYSLFTESENDIGYEIKTMSLLTRNILEGIDYETCRKRRIDNIKVIKEKLSKYNQIGGIINNYPLMCYPFMYRKDGLREYLVSKKIYVPQWWKKVLEMTEEETIENKLSKWLYPLPVDHRQTKEDMINISNIVIEGIEG